MKKRFMSLALVTLLSVCVCGCSADADEITSGIQEVVESDEFKEGVSDVVDTANTTADSIKMLIEDNSN